MNNHMMAAVLYGKEHLQVEPVAVPAIGSGDILVRVKVALTCGTDVKVFRRGYHARMIVPPAVFGHELAGDVVAVGEDVKISGSASAWWRRIPRPAMIASSASAASKISARTCCSITAHTPNTSAFPAASSNGTCTRFRRMSAIRMPRWSSRWPACCAVWKRPASRRRHRCGHRTRSHRTHVRASGQSSAARRVIAIGRRKTQLDRAAAHGRGRADLDRRRSDPCKRSAK